MFRYFSHTAPGITVFCLCVMLGTWFSSPWLSSPLSVAKAEAPSTIQQLQQKLADQQTEILRLQRQQVQLRSKLQKDYTKQQQQHLELLGRYEALQQRVSSLESRRLLWIQTQPPGATVSINGKQQPGVTPTLRSLSEGRYQLKLTLNNHHDHEQTLELQGASSSEVVVRLKRKMMAGEEANIPSIGAKASYIPPGTFWMGSPDTEQGRDNDEVQHRVKLSWGFWMMKTEVTRGQFNNLMQYERSQKDCEGKAERCPVDSVRWHEAAAFANALSRKESLPECFVCTGSKKDVQCIPVADYLNCKGWRLPTEAEWEYAARAGTTTPFSTGDCISTEQTNYNGDNPHTGCPKGLHRNKVVDVGSFSPNAWGLYNMHGNVWEWVYDWYGSYGKELAVDPIGASKGALRVVRGGSWLNVAQHLRSAVRNGFVPSDGYNFVGFRLSRSLP